MKKYILTLLLFSFCTAVLAQDFRPHVNVKVNVYRGKVPPPEKNKYMTPEWSARNKRQGELFMAANKLKPEVMSLPSGLQYKIIKGGVGENPTLGDVVRITYRGRFIDGTVFDSTYTTGHPLTVRVASMIPGWQEAMVLMKPGSVWELYIPSTLAFGEKGIPGLIGPNMTVIYDVHLQNIDTHTHVQKR